MCLGAVKTMILTKLLSEVIYHGVFIKMPSGNHKFIGLYSKPESESNDEKLRPMMHPQIDKILGKMAFDLIEISTLTPEAGEFISEFVGTKDDIWAEKINLDGLRLAQVA